MAEYKTVRDKLIRHQGVTVECRADGTIYIALGGRLLDLSEAEASVVYSLLSDVTEYVGHQTEGQIEKIVQRADLEDA